jgi:hypothetical protein
VNSKIDLLARHKGCTMHVLDILDCQTQIENCTNKSGAVKSGYLKVRGRKRDLKWYDSFKRNNKYSELKGRYVGYNREYFEEFEHPGV